MLYLYGMRLRGFSIGCQPKEGFQWREDCYDGKYYDVIVYNRQLSREERDNYDLDWIGTREEGRYEKKMHFIATYYDPSVDAYWDEEIEAESIQAAADEARKLSRSCFHELYVLTNEYK